MDERKRHKKTGSEKTEANGTNGMGNAMVANNAERAGSGTLKSCEEKKQEVICMENSKIEQLPNQKKGRQYLAKFTRNS